MSKDQLVKDYYSSHYKHVNKGFDLEVHTRLISHEIKDFLSTKNDSNQKILDIGSGTGALLRSLQDLGFTRLYGVELSKQQVEKSRSFVKNVSITHADAATFLMETTDQFDTIFMFDLIEHIPKEEIIPLLSLCKKALKNAGKLVIRTPNADSPFFGTRTRYIDITHEIAFNEESISMALREAGFSSIRCRETAKAFSSKLSYLAYPIRFVLDIPLKLHLMSYTGMEGLKTKMTPNFITIATKE